MRAIPELDASGWKEVGYRHHGGTDNAKCVLDPMHLQDFDKRFFGGHFHFLHSCHLESREGRSGLIHQLDKGQGIDSTIDFPTHTLENAMQRYCRMGKIGEVTTVA
jgi:hypothetical protein